MGFDSGVVVGQMKLIRVDRGINLHQLAEKTDISYDILFKYEHASRIMSLEHAYRITTVLGCTLEQLVGREEYVCTDKTLV